MMMRLHWASAAMMAQLTGLVCSPVPRGTSWTEAETGIASGIASATVALDKNSTTSDLVAVGR